MLTLPPISQDELYTFITVCSLNFNRWSSVLKIVVVCVPMFMFVSQDDYEKIVNGRVLLEDIMALSDVIKRYFRL